MSNLVIQTNVLALNSHRNAKNIATLQEKSSAKLSSGYKINSAADDAAGLAISEKMRAQIRGLEMASKNAQDSISLIQTAEGGMQEIDNMAQRIRELIVYAANDTGEHNLAGTGDRQKIQDEIDQLVQEIDSMANRVEFNKKRVINGSNTNNEAMMNVNASKIRNMLDAYVSSNVVTKATATTERAKLTGANVRADAVAGVGTSVLGDAYYFNLGSAVIEFTGTGSIATADNNNAKAFTVNALNTAISNSFLVAGAKADWAGTVSDIANADLYEFKGILDTVIAGMEQGVSALSESDVSALKELKKLAAGIEAFAPTMQAAINLADQVDLYADKFSKEITGNTLYFQVGANANQGMTLNIGSVTTDYLGIGNGYGKTNIDVLKNTGVGGMTNELNKLDVALSNITTERSKLGAAQNRLEYTIKSLDISNENLSASESRVRNTDMAKEMMNLTKSNILQQAAVSMLAQANQAPQSVLQLLR